MPHTCFKHCGFILSMQYGMFYMDRCEQSGEQESVFETHSPVHQTAPTNASKM